ncbi:MAG: hypothetical protein KBG00_17065, partial [Rhodoferax sp.]|nr:hypothetical protein [Rhodoferax sp.]
LECQQGICLHVIGEALGWDGEPGLSLSLSTSSDDPSITQAVVVASILVTPKLKAQKKPRRASL